MSKVCQQGGKIAKFRIRIPLGEIEISSCSIGLHRLETVKHCSSLPAAELEQPVLISRDQDHEATENASSHITACLDFFRAYFGDSTVDVHALRPLVCWHELAATPFAERVLRALYTEVRLGQRLTYSALAARVDAPNAQRAVGTCMRRNPIALIIPCHRVVKAADAVNNVGNYSNGGAEVKQWLLEHESRRRLKWLILSI